MIKLYKKIDGILHYWECWDSEDKKSATIHWGAVGDRGQDEVVSASTASGCQKLVQAEINQVVAEGYSEIPDEELHVLLIEYTIDGVGSSADLRKRHDLEDRMQETLGWIGLGHCDGGSIGSGTMEICCFVVDFETARKVIEDDLKGTDFGNYSRIYDEDR